MKNLKISKKLAVCFTIIILLTVIPTVVSLLSMSDMVNQAVHNQETITEPLDLMVRFSIAYGNARSALRDLGHSQVLEEDVQIYLTSALNDLEQAIGYLRGYYEVLSDNAGRDPVEYQTVRRVYNSIYEYTDIAMNRLLPVMGFGGERAVPVAFRILHDELGPIDASIKEDMLFLAQLNSQKGDTSVEQARNGLSGSIITATVITAVVILIAVFLAIYVSRSITKPINKVVSIVEDVAKGNINVNIDRKNMFDDETGTLLRYVYGLVDVIKSMIDDLIQANHEVNTVGNIDYKLDASKYQNSFKELMESVNSILDHSNDDVLITLEALNKIADGDFNVAVQDMPGKKMILPETIRAVVSNVKEIYDSALYLAQNASDGNLEISVDSDKFKGSWAELAHILNNLMLSIKQPLDLIEHNVTLMANGDFSVVDEDMKGDFKAVNDACNVANVQTQAIIEEIADILGHMANGDLTQTVNKEYKGSYAPIKEAMEAIIKSLKDTMSEIKTAVEHVALGAEQISNSAMHLADGATRQTSSVEELSSAISLIHEKASSANTEATKAKKDVERSQEYAVAGSGAVSSMSGTMDKIKASNEAITKIIDVITNIAFQTNLLALNASVEAARAGEHGKGFSVVADEVRTLAARSQQSSSDTMAIIDKATANAEEGMAAAGEVVASFETIEKTIGEVAGLISHISKMSHEQLESISTINSNVTEIADVVTSTSATAEESAAASQQLNSQAEMLRQKVAFFKL